MMSHRTPLYVALCLLWCTLLPLCASAQSIERMSDFEQELYGERAHVTADFQTMKAIRRYWEQEVLKLKNSNRPGYEFSLIGNNESVLKVTIPSDDIFVPGDSVLSSTSDSYLFPLVRLLRGEEAVASVIVSCYSDNNGSDRFLRRITSARAATVGRWMRKQGVDPTQITCYGLAQHSARTDNSTLQKRRQNRRLCLYLVPNKHMVKLAKKGKL